MTNTEVQWAYLSPFSGLSGPLMSSSVYGSQLQQTRWAWALGVNGMTRHV